MGHRHDLLGIFRRADTGDGMNTGVHAVGRHTAQKIQLIGTGGGDDQLCIHDLGLLQNLPAGAVATYSHGVVPFHGQFQNLWVRVDNG